ncbi:hypothetical protein HPT27_03575 [Permianibacter sp. IMCC34836]|uniref:hypothetical protein n=1 Tax=Permianibacter fluminis TaxID=2738515 RepID=UPI00155723A6|nr:hypothetical protein [Permianibacter fluminis]NQD36090.1 hypothetical protein [Permianibacter fluminis]
MEIHAPGNEDLLARWKRNHTFLRVEVVGANVALSFTGVLERYSPTEIVVSRNSDELSISTFCGAYSINEGPIEPDPEGFWQTYRRVVQVTTDGGAQCHIYELRNVHACGVRKHEGPRSCDAD